jgi:hypothetical protein
MSDNFVGRRDRRRRERRRQRPSLPHSREFVLEHVLRDGRAERRAVVVAPRYPGATVRDLGNVFRTRTLEVIS